jgi:hypothetical protein
MIEKEDEIDRTWHTHGMEKFRLKNLKEEVTWDIQAWRKVDLKEVKCEMID